MFEFSVLIMASYARCIVLGCTGGKFLLNAVKMGDAYKMFCVCKPKAAFTLRAVLRGTAQHRAGNSKRERLARQMLRSTAPSIFDTPEVELECGFSIFGGVLAGDVYISVETRKKWAKLFMQNATPFFP